MNYEERRRQIAKSEFEACLPDHTWERVSAPIRESFMRRAGRILEQVAEAYRKGWEDGADDEYEHHINGSERLSDIETKLLSQGLIPLAGLAKRKEVEGE